MFVVARGSLIVVCCLFFVGCAVLVDCVLFVVGCWLFVVGGWLLFGIVGLLVLFCVLRVGSSLFIVR